jgi:hypothetical protein
VLIAERSHAAAARERRAFGIPPSESVEVYQQRASQLLSHAESNLSSVGSVYWQEEEELSPGAETLFRKLSVNDMGRQSQSQQVFNVSSGHCICLTDLALRTKQKTPNDLVPCHQALVLRPIMRISTRMLIGQNYWHKLNTIKETEMKIHPIPPDAQLK